MKVRIGSIFSTVCLLCVLTAPSYIQAAYTKGQSPEIIKTLTEYYESGNYFKDIEAEINKARKYLDIQIRNRKEAKLAIVLDIDETALSNYASLKRMHFTGNTDAFTGAYLQGDAPAIDPILNLYQHAIDHNVAVFFITGRPHTPEISTVTVMNLKRAGYHTWEDIYMRPISNDKLSTTDYKTYARKDIAHKGYEIILNIGDQPDDLKGGYTEAKVKIPNPFYQISLEKA